MSTFTLETANNEEVFKIVETGGTVKIVEPTETAETTRATRVIKNNERSKYPETNLAQVLCIWYPIILGKNLYWHFLIQIIGSMPST